MWIPEDKKGRNERMETDKLPPGAGAVPTICYICGKAIEDGPGVLSDRAIQGKAVLLVHLACITACLPSVQHEKAVQTLQRGVALVESVAAPSERMGFLVALRAFYGGDTGGGIQYVTHRMDPLDPGTEIYTAILRCDVCNDEITAERGKGRDRPWNGWVWIGRKQTDGRFIPFNQLIYTHKGTCTDHLFAALEHMAEARGGVAENERIRALLADLQDNPRR